MVSGQRQSPNIIAILRIRDREQNSVGASRPTHWDLEKLGFEYIGTVLYGPTGLRHPSYVRERPEPAGLYPPLTEP